jgi:Flp pilus assembly pilin Flp
MASRTLLDRSAFLWSIKVKFLSRFVKIERSPVTTEYGLIASAMALALLAVMPVLASSIAAALGR